jgi:hypothetical protein
MYSFLLKAFELSRGHRVAHDRRGRVLFQEKRVVVTPAMRPGGMGRRSGTAQKLL